MKKVNTQSFKILNTDTNCIKDVVEVMLKFMLLEMIKRSLRLVSNCTPFRLLQKMTLFLEGCVNFEILPLKLVRLTNVEI